jgi:hypothetical protein
MSASTHSRGLLACYTSSCTVGLTTASSHSNRFIVVDTSAVMNAGNVSKQSKLSKSSEEAEERSVEAEGFGRWVDTISRIEGR